MGAPMAKNLIKAGYKLNVYDINPVALEEMKKSGANVFPSIKETIQDAEVVITMVIQGKIVEELYLKDGILKYAKAGTLLIDCSTIDPTTSRKVAKEAAAAGFEMIDAPVSGGTAGAAAGTLTFIVGGKESVLEKAKAILSKMGANIFHAGSSGAGQVAKICNNMLLAIHMIGTSEAINLGVENGLDPKVLSEIMKKSSGGNWSLEKYNPFPGVMESVPASRGYEGGFGNTLMSKDLSLAQDAALNSKTSTPLGSLAQNLYAIHAKKYPHLDFSSIIQTIQGK
jgi:3-hydroxyisobutyrate dehydrogenase